MRDILRISQDTVSLEQPLGEDDFNLSDVLEDDGAPAPSDAATRAMLSEAVRNVLADLSERERKVVRLRFGLDDGQARTLEEVGQASSALPGSGYVKSSRKAWQNCVSHCGADSCEITSAIRLRASQRLVVLGAAPYP